MHNTQEQFGPQQNRFYILCHLLTILTDLHHKMFERKEMTKYSDETLANQLTK